MELRIEPYKSPEQILFNYEELKEALMEKCRVYETVVYGEDQIKMAKADRASLNRLKKALNDERLKREREYMKPFDDFKAKINEIIRIIDKPASVIDQQIKAAEEQQKADKLTKIQDYWETMSPSFAPSVRLDQIFEDKWLNASVSMKSIQDAIDAKIQQIAKDLSVVRSLPSYGFEAEQMYHRTLDLAKAVSEAHRLQELAEKKAAYEAEQEKRKAEAAAIKPTEPADIPCTPWGAENIPPELPTEPLREWVRFQALMTVDEAKALGQYMRSHGIKYKSV